MRHLAQASRHLPSCLSRRVFLVRTPSCGLPRHPASRRHRDSRLASDGLIGKQKKDRCPDELGGSLKSTLTGLVLHGASGSRSSLLARSTAFGPFQDFRTPGLPRESLKQPVSQGSKTVADVVESSSDARSHKYRWTARMDCWMLPAIHRTGICLTALGALSQVCVWYSWV